MSSGKGKGVATDADLDEQQHTASTTMPQSSGAGSSTGGNQPVRKSKTIRSDGEINLQGPMDIVGSVKSGSNVTFDGDFTVREKIEAYGAIDVNGNLVCK